MIEPTYEKLTIFRFNAYELCTAVSRGEKELIVTRYDQPLFRVIKCDRADRVSYGLTYMRNYNTQFIQALSEHEKLNLSHRDQALVTCIKL
jgi:hypothetical protein